MNDETPLRRRDEARALFRNAILDAAEAVFAERGFHGARIQDIAERARIAAGTVYNHFEDKDDVLWALLEHRSEAMVSHLAPIGEETGPFSVTLRGRVARMLDYVRAHRDFFAIANEQGLFAGTVAPGARAATKRLRYVERLRAVFRALVEEGIASGDLEPLPGDTLVRFFGGTIRAFILSIAERTAVDDADADATSIVELFLHGAARRKKPMAKPAR